MAGIELGRAGSVVLAAVCAGSVREKSLGVLVVMRTDYAARDNEDATTITVPNRGPLSIAEASPDGRSPRRAQARAQIRFKDARGSGGTLHPGPLRGAG